MIEANRKAAMLYREWRLCGERSTVRFFGRTETYRKLSSVTAPADEHSSITEPSGSSTSHSAVKTSKAERLFRAGSGCSLK